MVDSLRDQLLRLGFRQQSDAKRGSTKKTSGTKVRRVPKASVKAASGSTSLLGEEDLVKAYVLRARMEEEERRQAERKAAETTRLRHERKQKIRQLLHGNVLNQSAAEYTRHFEYGGRIRRVYVNAAQRVALNAGELGIVQHAGRYLLVSRGVAEQVRDIDPRALALLPPIVTPMDTGNIECCDEDGVPDDLVW